MEYRFYVVRQDGHRDEITGLTRDVAKKKYDDFDEEADLTAREWGWGEVV